jgi:hypothetical protein
MRSRISAAKNSKRDGTAWHLLERRRPFSQSLLWELQRRYFAERGVDAWRQGEVPHYLTSNPRIADAYAEMVFAFLRDRERLGEAAAEPLHICELGAGSGRLAFHFLSRLARRCAQAGLPLDSFRYLLTDEAEANLRFWRAHPRFRPFFDAGILDVARFDIGRSGEVALQVSGKTIAAGSLARPLVVVANYVFDSIPQDLFHVSSGECEECLVSLAVDEDPRLLDTAGLLERVQCRCERRPLAGPAYAEPWLEELLAGYRGALSDTYLLFPAAALRCLRRLRALSKQGLLLLSADKGDHRLTSLQGSPPPSLVRHGSFSLNVNYHAVKSYCERTGGLALFPRVRHASLNVSACLFLDGATDHPETRCAYGRHVQDFSPDDFYTITRHARQTIGRMSVEDILAYLRLGHYDAHQFGRYLPRLIGLAPALDREQHRAVTEAVDRVWDLYFPLGEELDLADGIARLLYEMDDYRRALQYFQRSIEIYGAHAGTLANMETCRRLLGEELERNTKEREVIS